MNVAVETVNLSLLIYNIVGQYARIIPRRIDNEIQAAVRRQAAVVLIGPRQVGKTTLAHTMAEILDSLYLDLEELSNRDKLSEPSLFLENYEDKLVILDEIHRVPEIFSSLRGIIDQGRRKGKRVGRFLILGSASLELLKQSGHSLAGRVEFISLAPLCALELDNSKQARELLWLRGGFPDSFLAKNSNDSYVWRRNFIKTCLERDIATFGFRISTVLLERLWIMLAQTQGNTLNSSQLANALETSVQSVTRYIDLLCDLLLVRRLPPYHSNLGKRMIKSPKVYVRDSGLVHALLAISSFNGLNEHPVVGRSWEGFVIESLLSVLPVDKQAFYYRTRAGAEIDLVIEHGHRTVWAIEIKRSLSPKVSRGFHSACEDIKPTRRFVVHAGDERFPVSQNLEAISVRQLAEEIQNSCISHV